MSERVKSLLYIFLIKYTGLLFSKQRKDESVVMEVVSCMFVTARGQSE